MTTAAVGGQLLFGDGIGRHARLATLGEVGEVFPEVGDLVGKVGERVGLRSLLVCCLGVGD